MVIYEKAKPYLKRVAQVNDVSEKIQRYGIDNLYPQIIDELMKRSYTLKRRVNSEADFLNGEGFTDPNIAKLIVNKRGLKGQSLNKVLTDVSKAYAAYETIPLHIGYNLNFTISSITPLPFEFIRFGLKDPKTKKVFKLAYSSNWERDGRKDTDQNIKFYDVFDPEPACVEQQIIKAGGIQNYKGQILYLTPVDGQYPLATFDAVADDAQTQAEIGVFKVSNIQNSFLSTLGILYPGAFAGEQEKQDFNDLIANKTGSRAAGSRIGLQDPTGTKSIKDLLVSLDPVNLDKFFEATEKSVKDAILEDGAWPKILLGMTPNGLFAQADFEEAYTYANSITRNKRSALSEAFSTILQYWETPIISDCQIIEQRYILNSSLGSNVDVNDNLKNMTGMQAVNFARILRKYSEGKYSRQIAQSLLRQGFGLSDDEITKLLDGIDTAKTEDTGIAPTATPQQTQAYYLSLAKEYL